MVDGMGLTEWSWKGFWNRFWTWRGLRMVVRVTPEYVSDRIITHPLTGLTYTILNHPGISSILSKN